MTVTSRTKIMKIKCKAKLFLRFFFVLPVVDGWTDDIKLKLVYTVVYLSYRRAEQSSLPSHTTHTHTHTTRTNKRWCGRRHLLVVPFSQSPSQQAPSLRFLSLLFSRSSSKKYCWIVNERRRRPPPPTTRLPPLQRTTKTLQSIFSFRRTNITGTTTHN